MTSETDDDFLSDNMDVNERTGASIAAAKLAASNNTHTDGILPPYTPMLTLPSGNAYHPSIPTDTTGPNHGMIAAATAVTGNAHQPNISSIITDPTATGNNTPQHAETSEQKHGNGNTLDAEMPDADQTTTPRRIRVYQEAQKGPYNVYIRASKDTPLKHVTLSKYLFSKYPAKQIGKITQMNNHKLRVEFNSSRAANDFVSTDDPTFKSFRVYIPAEQVEVEGVVRLSVDDDEAELLDYGRGQFGQPSIPELGVIGVYRFERATRDATGAIVDRAPTSLVRVTFPGALLPARVVMNGLILPVEPYRKKAMFCENCLRTGHTQKFCVVKARCAKCGSEHSTRDCNLRETTPKCFVCGTNHDPSDRTRCPKIQQANSLQHQKTKRKMAQSYAEAVKSLLHPDTRQPSDTNPFGALSLDEDSDEQPLHEMPSSSHQPVRKRRKKATDSSQASKGFLPQSQTPPNAPSTGKPRVHDRAEKSQKANSNGVGFIRNQSSARQPDQSPSNAFRSLVTNLINCLPISEEWRQMIDTAIDAIFNALIPLISPILISTLFNPSSTRFQYGSK